MPRYHRAPRRRRRPPAAQSSGVAAPEAANAVLYVILAYPRHPPPLLHGASQGVCVFLSAVAAGEMRPSPLRPRGHPPPPVREGGELLRDRGFPRRPGTCRGSPPSPRGRRVPSGPQGGGAHLARMHTPCSASYATRKRPTDTAMKLFISWGRAFFRATVASSGRTGLRRRWSCARAGRGGSPRSSRSGACCRRGWGGGRSGRRGS